MGSSCRVWSASQWIVHFQNFSNSLGFDRGQQSNRFILEGNSQVILLNWGARLRWTTEYTFLNLVLYFIK